MSASGGASVRALVIDDSEISRDVIRATLEPRGWVVHTLESALGATAALVRHQTNVLVCDVNMPVMSGGKFVELVRKNPRLDHVKLVLVSGDSETELQELGERLGADAMLPKRVLAERLVPTIERLLASRRDTPAEATRGTILFLGETSGVDTVARLERSGATVVHRRGGRGCLLAMRERKPDVVFLSTSIDDMSVRAVIELIRENRGTERTPIVLVGDATETQLGAEAIRSGANTYVPLGLDDHTFRDRVSRILSTIRR